MTEPVETVNELAPQNVVDMWFVDRYCLYMLLQRSDW